MNEKAQPGPHRVAMVLYPGFASIDATGPLECFGLANYISGRQFYEILTVTEDGGPVPAAGAWLRMIPTHSFETLPEPVHTLLVPGGPAYSEAADHPALISWLRRRAETAERFGSVCNATFVLAATGAAAGRRVATHWLFADKLAADYPDIQVDADSVFVRSGKVWSSAGMTTGMDMALAMVEADHGRPLALEVARHLVLYLQRSSGQAQFSMHLKAQFTSLPAIERVQQHIVDHPAADLSIEALASVGAMSKRTLLRLFKDSTGASVGDYVANARLRHACMLLEHTDKELKEVAAAAGLGGEPNMRRVFARRLGISPSHYREKFQAIDAATGQRANAPAPYDRFWLHRAAIAPIGTGAIAR